MNSSLPLTFNGAHLSCSSTTSRPSAFLRWGMQDSQETTLTHLITRRNNGTAFQVLVSSNVSSNQGNFKGKSEVIMVDPLEAKRLAAKQMLEIQAEEKYERQRQIEAINGAWAMIGLTAGLVIEGRTGDSILAQLMGYWSVIMSFFGQILPPGLINQFQSITTEVIPPGLINQVQDIATENMKNLHF